eukprot:TRINITY_DN1544_c0_g4_i2.p1 TRINITY_DN1544_c0_g4~~TRINITY_DN1544_c0_g4_i2.p1  ORF type:complete len:131 (+),score=27.64 TRINITY_DN1544_c0_g4_i2:120-512(+)
MRMYFEWGYNVQYPFDNWQTHNAVTYWFSLLAVLVTTIFLQFFIQKKQTLNNYFSRIDNTLLGLKDTIMNRNESKIRKILIRLYRALLLAIQSFTLYLLMFFAMTYDPAVFMVIVFGSVMGHFIFFEGCD